VAIFLLVIAPSGLLLGEGGQRGVHVAALALVGLTNLALALGSLLPEEAGGRPLRRAMVPLSGFMFMALFAAVALRREGQRDDLIRVAMIAAVITVVVLAVRRQSLPAR
jgi:hypothetical protein